MRQISSQSFSEISELKFSFDEQYSLSSSARECGCSFNIILFSVLYWHVLSDVSYEIVDDDDDGFNNF